MNNDVKNTENKGERWCSIQEAAEILGVSYQTVRRRIISGDLEVRKEGQRYFVRLSDVEKLAERMEKVSKGKIDRMIWKEVELRLAGERIRALQEQVRALKERIRELESDKGFLLEQLKEKDRIIKELIPKALPKAKGEGSWLGRLFKKRDRAGRQPDRSG